jgi:hypothetical protein
MGEIEVTIRFKYRINPGHYPEYLVNDHERARFDMEISTPFDLLEFAIPETIHIGYIIPEGDETSD